MQEQIKKRVTRANNKVVESDFEKLKEMCREKFEVSPKKSNVDKSLSSSQRSNPFVKHKDEGPDSLEEKFTKFSTSKPEKK